MATELKPASAVRYFVPDSPQKARTLRGKLLEEINTKSKSLIEGYAQDWADYSRRVGVLDGLSIAVDLCDGVEKELTE